MAHHEQGDVRREHADVGDLIFRLRGVLLEDRVPPAELPNYCVDNSVSQKSLQISTRAKRQASSLCVNCRNGRKLRGLLGIAGGRVFEFPVVVEQVLEVCVIPYGRLQCPLAFKTAGKGVFTTAEGA